MAKRRKMVLSKEDAARLAELRARAKDPAARRADLQEQIEKSRQTERERSTTTEVAPKLGRFAALQAEAKRAEALGLKGPTSRDIDTALFTGAFQPPEGPAEKKSFKALQAQRRAARRPITKRKR